MREVEAYETSDGKIFISEDEAKDHQENIIGELLDDLLEDDDRGNVTRADRHNILMKMLKNPQLKQKIQKLNFALEHGDYDE